MDGILSLYDQLYTDLVEGGDAWLTGYISADIVVILGSALAVVVGFVAFKLIKRALNKA